MKRLCYLIFLQLMTTTNCRLTNNDDGNVVNVKKPIQLRKLSSKDFHEFNLAHVLFNYNPEEVTTQDVDRLKNVHNLQYRGKISIGSPKQDLNVIFETAIPDVIVLGGNACTFPNNLFSTFCWSHRTYKEHKSFPGDPDHIVWDAQVNPTFELFVKTSRIQGHLLFDRIQIGQLKVRQSLIGVIDKWGANFLYGQADGIVGLGRAEDSYFPHDKFVTAIEEDMNKIKTTAVLVQSLEREGSSAIAYHLHKDKKGNEFGDIVLGAEQKTEQYRFKGDLHWVPVPDFHGFYWRTFVTEIQFIGIGDGVLEWIDFRTNTAGLAVPDPGTSLFAGPTEVVENIHEHMFRGLDVQRIGKPDHGSVEFDCTYVDQLPIIVLVIDEIGYMFESKDYVKKLKNTCTSGFMGVDTLQTMILGDTLFQKYYVVFDNSNRRIGFAHPQK